MKVKDLDNKYMWKNGIDDTSEPLRHTLPVTEEDMERNKRNYKSVLSSLKHSENEILINNLLNADFPEIREGKPWTTRLAIIACMYSSDYEYQKRSDKTDKAIPEKPEIVAEMQNIGLAFIRAPKHGYVELSADNLKLIRRKAYELPLKPEVKALLDERLDEIEGIRNKHLVTFGIEETLDNIEKLDKSK